MHKENALYFDCFSGISGDMFLGALVDLELDLSEIILGLEGLKIKGYKIKSSNVKRNGISATKIKVDIDNSYQQHTHRSFKDIKKLLHDSRLPEKVKTDSIEIFHRIGKVEAKIHRTALNKIHFHEIGGLDSIVDIVGSALGINLLNITKIFSSPLNTGEGLVKCQHGLLPIPAPATLNLLKGIPCYSDGTKKELTTPTGAAIIGYYAEEFCSLPNMNILKTGYGAGDHKIKSIPNILRVIRGEINTPVKSSLLKLIETNIDDMNPEFYEYIMSELFKAGAADVFFTPIYMKKNRPGVKLSVLVSDDKHDLVVSILFKETSTFGIRYCDNYRKVLTREEKTIKTTNGNIRVKLGYLNDEIIKITPEYEDCKKIARSKKIPIKEIYGEALRLAEDLKYKKRSL